MREHLDDNLSNAALADALDSSLLSDVDHTNTPLVDSASKDR